MLYETSIIHLTKKTNVQHYGLRGGRSLLPVCFQDLILASGYIHDNGTLETLKRHLCLGRALQNSVRRTLDSC